jgi:predicted ribosome quality control (RQC) complex YloA/Tae2 family protein
MRVSFSYPCGLELTRLVRDLGERIGGGFIQKVHQTREHVFSFRIHRPGWTGWLVFSARPEVPCLTLAADRAREPGGEGKTIEPPPLCRVLRRDVEGCGIEAVQQTGRDRIVTLEIAGGRRIVFEILGKFANLLVLSPGGVIDHCLRKDSRRPVAPGAVYEAPDLAGKLPPDTEQTIEALRQVFAEFEGAGGSPQSDETVREICRRIAGLSPLVAREIAHRVSVGFLPPGEAFESIRREIEDGSGAFVFRDSSGAIECATPVLMQHLTGSHKTVEIPTFIEALEQWYGKTAEDLDRERLREGFLARLRERRKRVRRDLAAAKRDRKEGEGEDELRKAAEMILAQPHRVKKGMEEVTLENLYEPDGPPLTVSLDPLLDPRQNAERYFSRAAKARRKREQSRERVEELAGLLEQLEELIGEAETAASFEDLQGMDDRVRKAAGEREKVRGKRGRKQEAADPVRRVARVFAVPSGPTIWVARGGREGDELLRRFAKGSDLWLHTRDVPGSHVVVRKRSKDEPVPEEALLDAAHLAAHFSKAKGEKIVPLHLTEVKHLRRPREGKPGKVIIGKERTFTVRIEEERLRRLLGKRQ